MNRTAFPLTLVISTLLLASCAHMPKLFWKENEGSGVPAKAGSAPSAQSEQALVVPPNLRGQVSVPMPNKVASVPPSPAPQATANEQSPAGNQKIGVAGTAVGLHTRVYNQDAATVFSSVVDAMTSLNMPVQSVDSPSGTITTGWIRTDASSPNMSQPTISLLGSGGIRAVRYRFVVRVLRLNAPAGVKTELEIRTLGQVFENRHWFNKPIKDKPSNDLFSAVDDQLARRAQAAAAAPASSGTAAPAASAPSAPVSPAAK